MNNIIKRSKKSISNDSNVLRLLSFILLFMILLFIINGVIPQFEMLIFHGNISIKITTFKIILLALCIGTVLLSIKKSIKKQKSIMISWMVLIVYLSIEFIILSLTQSIDLNQFITSIMSQYFFALIIPVFVLLQDTIDEKNLVRIFVVLFLALAIIGLFQYLLKDPLLPVTSNDNKFKIFSYDDFTNNVRAFSLFDSGYSFGHFIALVGAIVVSSSTSKINKIPLISLVVFAGYSTLTRNTYFEITFVLLSAFLFKKLGCTKKNQYLILIFNFVFGYIVMKYADIISTTVSSIYGHNDLLSTATHASRMQEWSVIMDSWLNKNVYTSLFGTGLSQDYGFVAVDNMYLAIGAQIGIVGLIVFAFLFLEMTRYIFKKGREQTTTMSMAISSMWTSLPFISFFNISLPEYILFFCLLLLLNCHDGYKLKNGNN